MRAPRPACSRILTSTTGRMRRGIRARDTDQVPQPSPQRDRWGQRWGRESQAGERRRQEASKRHPAHTRLDGVARTVTK